MMTSRLGKPTRIVDSTSHRPVKRSEDTHLCAGVSPESMEPSCLCVRAPVYPVARADASSRMPLLAKGDRDRSGEPFPFRLYVLLQGRPHMPGIADRGVGCWPFEMRSCQPANSRSNVTHSRVGVEGSHMGVDRHGVARTNTYVSSMSPLPTDVWLEMESVCCAVAPLGCGSENSYEYLELPPQLLVSRCAESPDQNSYEYLELPFDPLLKSLRDGGLFCKRQHRIPLLLCQVTIPVKNWTHLYSALLTRIE